MSEWLEQTMIQSITKYRFLFEELVKRDFKKKYKRTVLGMGWSLLSPLLRLLVMKIIFTQFFGRTTPHYTIYLFSGLLIFSFFASATRSGMDAMMENVGIISKVKVPKALFVVAKNVQGLISFLLTMVVFFLFVLFDRISFHLNFFMLIIPIVSLVILNIGVGMILAALNIFFRDIKYLYDIFINLLRYTSAIFYTIDRYPEIGQKIFMLNPVYVHIKYFRMIVLDGVIPSLAFHGWMLLGSLGFLLLGCLVFKKSSPKFLYYL